MYINYPKKFSTKVDYVHNLFKDKIYNTRGKNKKEKEKSYSKEKNINDIYKEIDNEYAEASVYSINN